MIPSRAASARFAVSWTRQPFVAALVGSLIIITSTFCFLYSFSSRISGISTWHAAGGKIAHHVSDGSKQDDTYMLHPQDHIFRKPQTIKQTWEVTKELRAPDGVEKPVYLINGQFPGPLIEARSGDELVITVYNELTDEGEGISIHWHGLTMRGANDMDGAVGITQCAIAALANFTYSFRIEESQFGTYWYHAHSGVQRADGLYGGLVIHKPSDDYEKTSDLSIHQYEEEHVLMIGDWHHRTAEEVLKSFEDPRFLGNEPVPDSMLINGKGSYNCSNAVPARPVNCSSVERPIVTLAGSNRIRVRIINTGTSAGFTLSITHGSMKVIAVDGGHPVASGSPAMGSIGVLYPGERMDVLVDRGGRTTRQSAELVVTLDGENMRIINFALTAEQAFPLRWGTASAGDFRHQTQRLPTKLPHLSLSDVKGAPIDTPPAFTKPAETAVLYSTMQIRSANHNKPVGTVNHTSWVLLDSVQKPLLSLDREKWVDAIKQPTSAQKFKVPWFKDSGEDRWMELVLNNFDDKGHPFHMHGYSFYVVATQNAQPGAAIGYNPFDAAAKAEVTKTVNEVSPLRKDTVYVPPMGYVVLRSPLENDGLWLLHCHVLWHQMIGMGIVIQVGEVAEVIKERASVTCPRKER